MAMVGSVIELDREAAEAPRGEPGLPPYRWRWLALAVAAAVCVAALVSADPSPGGRLVEVARIDPASVVTMRVAGPTLFAVTPRGGPHLVAYRLADGARQWSVPLTESGADAQVSGFDVVDGAVVVTMHSGLAYLPTVAVDAATGRELWREDLPQVGVRAGGTVVLGTYLNPGGGRGDAPYPGADGPSQPLLLHGVRPRTGQLVWTYQVPAGWRVVLPIVEADARPATAFVVVAPDGHATAVSLATGGARASATIDAVPTDQSGIPGSPVKLYDDQLVLVATRQGRPTLAAYRADTLGEQWTATLPTTDVFLSRCGPWQCASYLNATHAIAAATGTPAWTMTNTPQSMGWLAGWIYECADPTHPDSAVLIDPVTRQVVLPLGHWRISTPTTGPVLVTTAIAGTNNTLVGLLADGPRIEVLGVVGTRLQGGCEVGNGHLACATINDQLRIFTYEP